MRPTRLLRAAACLVATSLLSLAAAGAEQPSKAASLETIEARVRARETAFAKTMADRDLAAFATFVADEAVFAGRAVLRGRAAVVDGWRRHFNDKTAPFAWAAERVLVLDSGTLALSTGPVYDPAGKRTGTFTSTWRREKDGEWRVVLDSGCPPCPCP